ncbi:protoplast secreted protein 2 precursor [Ramicandelaber brevisporus]|nr:protoplast secreted protein 2 precursor [Ramicandelaber brevisporus]
MASVLVPKAKIAVVFHSIHHHVYRLALKVKEGIETVPNTEVKLLRVRETLSPEILAKMHAPAELSDIPVASAQDLADADAFIFGAPSRFGTASAQVRALLDSTGGLWASGALAGKHAGIFFSSSQQTGGQETVALTFTTFFAHHGINFVPLGYRHKALFQIDELAGGSPWGAGTITGNGVPLDVRPTALELDVAKTQGQIFGEVVTTAAAGKALKAAQAAEQKN